MVCSCFFVFFLSSGSSLTEQDDSFVAQEVKQDGGAVQRTVSISFKNQTNVSAMLGFQIN